MFRHLKPAILGSTVPVLGLALTAALFTTDARAAEQWDLPAAYPAGNHHTQYLEEFANRVGDRTDGEISITVHPNGSLFPGDDIVRAVRTGQAAIGERLVSAMGNEHPIFEVDAVPFLASNFDESWALYQATRPHYEELLEERNLKFVYALPWPPQGLFTRDAVESVEDMEGVRFRAYNVATARLAELFGAVPTQVEAAELSQALATGVADSMFTSGATGRDMKVWEHLDYYYDVQAWIPFNIIMINMQTWESLDEDTQATIMEIGKEIEEEGWQEVRQLTDELNRILSENGMNVERPSDQFAADLREIGQTMTEEWVEKAGERGQELLSRYDEVR